MSLSKPFTCDFNWCRRKGVCFKYNTKDGCNRQNCPNKHVCRRHLFLENVELDHRSDPPNSCALQTEDFIENRWAVNHNGEESEPHPEATAQTTTPKFRRRATSVYSKPKETEEIMSLKQEVDSLKSKLQAAEVKIQAEHITYEIQSENKAKELELSQREIALLRAEKEHDKRSHEQQARELRINFEMKTLQLERKQKYLFNEFRKRCENLTREKAGWRREIEELKKKVAAK